MRCAIDQYRCGQSWHGSDQADPRERYRERAGSVWRLIPSRERWPSVRRVERPSALHIMTTPTDRQCGLVSVLFAVMLCFVGVALASGCIFSVSIMPIFVVLEIVVKTRSLPTLNSIITLFLGPQFVEPLRKSSR